jgi:hypothetical protein
VSRVTSVRRCVTVREMKEGPSGSAIRSLILSHRELCEGGVSGRPAGYSRMAPAASSQGCHRNCASNQHCRRAVRSSWLPPQLVDLNLAALSPIEAAGGPRSWHNIGIHAHAEPTPPKAGRSGYRPLSIPRLAALSLYGRAVEISDLDPNRAPTGSIGAIHPLRDDSLGADAAGMQEHHRAIIGDVFVE